jgi:hypothetical protein
VRKEAFQENVSLLLFFDFAFLTFGFQLKAKNKTLKLKYTKPLHEITIWTNIDHDENISLDSLKKMIITARRTKRHFFSFFQVHFSCHIE